MMERNADQLTEKAQRSGLQVAGDMVSGVPYVGEAGKKMGEVYSKYQIQPYLDLIVFFKQQFNKLSVAVGETAASMQAQDDEISANTTDIKNIQNQPAR